MTRLESLIIESIERSGPIRFDHYMERCLLDEEHGYYRRNNPVGGSSPEGGDFITSPEISQIFGEIVGLWLLHQSGLQGISNPQLVELGPGNGTLMADALRAIAGTGALPPPVHLVEISEPLKLKQRMTLAEAPADDIKWHARIDSLPEEPLFIVANEFFDALPVRRFKALDGEWHELAVTLEGGRLAECLTPAPQGIDLPPASPGSETELCPALPGLADSLAERTAKHGGAVLVVDYGRDKPAGDSVQSVQRHRRADALSNCGEVDITAWVDFSVFLDAARSRSILAAGPREQGLFLRDLGLHERAEKLASGATPEQRRQLLAGVERLGSGAHMGTAFKALALLPRNTRLPVAGF